MRAHIAACTGLDLPSPECPGLQEARLEDQWTSRRWWVNHCYLKKHFCNDACCKTRNIARVFLKRLLCMCSQAVLVCKQVRIAQQYRLLLSLARHTSPQCSTQVDVIHAGKVSLKGVQQPLTIMMLAPTMLSGRAYPDTLPAGKAKLVAEGRGLQYSVKLPIDA